MPATTSRLALQYPTNSDPPNGASQMQTLATELDSLVTAYTSGVASARPSTPTQGAGTIYLATDTLEISFYNGTAWVDVGPAITLLLLQAKGDLILASASGAASRLPVGSDGKVLTARSTATLGVDWETTPETLLATQQYAPARTVYSISSGSLAAIDTTNLSLALTVPASGNVDVNVSAFVSISEGASLDLLTLALFQHGTTTQLGYSQTAAIPPAASTGQGATVSLRFHLTGLTPGSLQLDLAAGIATVSGASAVLVAQGVTGVIGATAAGSPVLLQAFAA